MRHATLSILLMFAGTVSWAQDSSEAPTPPGIPTDEERAIAEAAAKQPAEEPGEADAEETGLQARQTVIGDTTVTEYSRGGHVYSVKMKQKYGATQYLDVESDGQLQPAPEELYDNVNLPKWKLTNW